MSSRLITAPKARGQPASSTNGSSADDAGRASQTHATQPQADLHAAIAMSAADIEAVQAYENELARVHQEAYGAHGAASGLAPAHQAARSSKFSTEEEKEQWLAKRRETHKEVERRRRDAINTGISELAKLVPDCDKNKGSIVHKAVDYIRFLQRSGSITFEKWRDEKREAEETIKALQAQNKQLEEQNKALEDHIRQLERELEQAKRGAGGAAGPDPKRRKGDAA